MSDTYEIGDELKVALTGKVTRVDCDGEVFVTLGTTTFSFYLKDVAEGVQIEKVVAPFKAGDLIESKGLGFKYLLLNNHGNGYFDYLDLRHNSLNRHTPFEPRCYTVLKHVEEVAA